MLKAFFLFALIIAVSITGFLTVQKNRIEGKWENFSVITFKMGDKDLRLLVADTKASRMSGFKFYTEDQVKDIDGMIFYFPKHEIQSMWNQDTLLDLEVYWLDDTEIVGVSDLPSISKTGTVKIVTSPRPVDTAIELIKRN